MGMGNTMKIGRVKALKREGYGFIEMSPGKDRFFHARALRGMQFLDLKEGDIVEFSEEETEKGIRAADVILVASVGKKMNSADSRGEQTD